jgi:hypothetical protein
LALHHAESEWVVLTRKFRRFPPVPPDNPNPYTENSEWEEPAAIPPAAGLDEFDPDDFEFGEGTAQRRSPSLPIILFSAASGVSGGVIALFISYRWLQWDIELSAVIATLALLFSLGISGAILSAATGSRAAPVNIIFSCGVILLAIFFLALCLLVGALFSTLLVQF